MTAEEIAREKQTLPFGWGRFGKGIEHLATIAEPDESLLAVCVALNPDYAYKPGFVPGTLLGAGHAMTEFTKTMNIVLACTDRRLIALGTGGGGAPREHNAIPYAGLVIESRGKTDFVLALPGGQMRIRGAAKQQLPRFLEVLAAHAS